MVDTVQYSVYRCASCSLLLIPIHQSGQHASKSFQYVDPNALIRASYNVHSRTQLPFLSSRRFKQGPLTRPALWHCAKTVVYARISASRQHYRACSVDVTQAVRRALSRTENPLALALATSIIFALTITTKSFLQAYLHVVRHG